jgi:Holliday junction resolvase RusA-like endonuclease
VTTISFTIPGTPVPKGRPRSRVVVEKGVVDRVLACVRARRIGDILDVIREAIRVSTYTPAETEVAEDAFAYQCIRHRPRKPFAGPVRVDLVFLMPTPARLDADRSRDWPHVRPDVDNLDKLALDALSKGQRFWTEDSQVCGGERWKLYGHPSRTIVRIRPLTAEDANELRERIGEPVPQRSIFGG